MHNRLQTDKIHKDNFPCLASVFQTPESVLNCPKALKCPSSISPTPTVSGERQTNQQGIQQPSSHVPEMNNKVKRELGQIEGLGVRMQHPGVS